MAPRCQQVFHQHWGDLRDPHVRTLAWLLHAPDLLDAAWPGWEGRVSVLAAELPDPQGDWLRSLDRDPAPLHAHLQIHRFTRLGRYAEQLLAWYFREHGILHAQGVQVREAQRTLGEFDFLLEPEGRLWHRELATKVYLLRATQAEAQQTADYFVGPNLGDTLGAKVAKILERQVALSSHPAAAQVLPRPVDSACAWVKGWLFYPEGDASPARVPGLSAQHCRGSWCSLEEFAAGRNPGDGSGRYLMLNRLQWLTPQRAAPQELLTREALLPLLQDAFAQQNTPIMLARMEEAQECWIEASRCFVVPDSWRAAAALK
jgi:hypothetical protein